MEFGILLRLVPMNLIQFISSQISIQERDTSKAVSLKNQNKTTKTKKPDTFNVDMLSDIYWLSFKLGMLIDTDKLHSLIPV